VVGSRGDHHPGDCVAPTYILTASDSSSARAGAGTTTTPKVQFAIDDRCVMGDGRSETPQISPA
jgi:hypothetical protein